MHFGYISVDFQFQLMRLCDMFQKVFTTKLTYIEAYAPSLNSENLQNEG